MYRKEDLRNYSEVLAERQSQALNDFYDYVKCKTDYERGQYFSKHANEIYFNDSSFDEYCNQLKEVDDPKEQIAIYKIFVKNNERKLSRNSNDKRKYFTKCEYPYDSTTIKEDHVSMKNAFSSDCINSIDITPEEYLLRKLAKSYFYKKAKESHAFTEKQINVMILISYGDFKTDGEIEKFLGLKKGSVYKYKKTIESICIEKSISLRDFFLK